MGSAASKPWLSGRNNKYVINNAFGDEAGYYMEMAIMNRIESSAIETEFQWALVLVEAKYEIEQEAKDCECCETKCHSWDRKFAEWL
jgi:hypothetical protein